MKRIALAVMVLAVSGCAMQPPMSEQQYQPVPQKLVQISPECARPKGRVEAACRSSAQMLEAATPEKATAVFITHWENDVLNYLDDKARTAQAGGDFADDITAEMIYGKVRRQAINAVKRVSVPVLETIYRENPSEYSKRMSELLDLIDVGSRDFFETFQETHSKASMLD